MPTNSAKPINTPRTVQFVLFHRTKLIDVTGPLQVFNDARLPGGAPAYAVTLLSETGGAIETDTGFTLQTQALNGVSAPDTLLVSGGDSALIAANSPRLQAFLAEVAPNCRRFGSVCLGAFILARGGFLDGRRAVTHWENCAALANAYPQAKVHEDSIFEEDNGIWTSAGVTSGIDMALAMVEQDLGRAEALRLARTLVLYVKRSGGQRQFSAVLDQQMRANSGRFDALIARITANLAGDLSVPELAAMAGMSDRNFARVFTESMGTSPARYVESLRVEAASDALQRGESTLARLPWAYGFGSAERMRRAFHRVKGVAPLDYQQRFGP